MNNHEGIKCCNCSQKSPLFQGLSEEELCQISDIKIRVPYKAGEVIVKQGAPLTHVISFTSGLAKVYIESSNDKSLILHFIKPTQFLGGPGIYADNMHHFSVMAVEDSTVCFIEMGLFKSIIKKNCDFANAFMMHLSKNGIFNYERFISLTQKNMHGRIADGLLYLDDKIFDDRNHEIRISRHDLASLTGMSRDSAIRILKDLKEESIIEITNNFMKITNREKLMEISRKA